MTKNNNKKMKKRYHYSDPCLLNPAHPVTVVLAGCGGTGGRVLTSLAMIHASLQGLGHPGLHVTAYDGDRVEGSNIGRQLFYASDLHLNKALVLVSRVNRCYGTAWCAIPEYFNSDTALSVNIFISCVDTVKARMEIAEILREFSKKEKKYSMPYSKPLYWIDYGNSMKTGQVVLGTLIEAKQPSTRKNKAVAHLPVVTGRFDLDQEDDRHSGPSCSHAIALSRQDLFINSSLAMLGSHLLWELLREGRTDKAGLYLNLETMRSAPIPV